MSTLYEQILNKPKSYRRRLSYAITALLGIIIFAIWLMMTTLSMKEAFNSKENIDNATDSISEKNEPPSFEEEQGTENLEKIKMEESTTPSSFRK